MTLPTTDKLIQAYNQMMERIRHTLSDTETKVLPTLKSSLDKARETAVELGELTHDEAEKIALWLKRDTQDAGKHLAENSQELSDWLKFDIDQVEDRLLEIFTSVADKTRLEIQQLQQKLEQDPPHMSGEITAPGTLYCTQCNSAVEFNHTSHIPVCPKCGNESFRRCPVESS